MTRHALTALLLALAAGVAACADDASPKPPAPADAGAAEDASLDAAAPDAASDTSDDDAPASDTGDIGADASSDLDAGAGDAEGEDVGEDVADDDAADVEAADAEADAEAPDAGDEDADPGEAEDHRDAARPIPDTPAAATRPANTTCAAPARPPAAGAVRLEEAFGGVRFGQTVFLLQAPGDGSRWYVGGKDGVIRTFDASDAPTVALYADLRDRVGNDASEKGLLGMAFSPDFAASGEVYLSYTTPGTARNFVSRISRFRVQGGGAALDVGSEEIVFELVQPFNNHNGGHIAFGPDGYLYFGLGDGGSGGDPEGNGQNTQTLLGALLRLDVVGQDTYAIPQDNPFAGAPQRGLPEIYAWGFRNPWRFAFDPATGDLWLGDVGQNIWEEINRVERGGNYGWDTREGAHCYGRSTCDTAGLIDPVAEYPHAGRQRSVTGGVVYHGAALPGLAGRYLYADFYSGPLWALTVDPQTGAYAPEQLLETLPFLLATFAQGEDGEVYLPAFDPTGEGGAIYRLAPAEAPGEDTFPRLLSQTGCVDPGDPLRPAPGVLPYALNVPFWSDGAAKERWLALPDGAQLTVEADGDVTAPVGAVLIKNFDLGGRRIETRLMVRHADGGWGGYTYAWRADQSDAELLAAGQRVEIDGQPWLYPSRGQCFACHNAAAGFSLGLELGQLNREIQWLDTGVTGNQLATFDALGLFDAPLPEATSTLPAPHEEATPAAHARAWLHANCASCHRPGHPIPAELDLRWEVLLPDTRTCDVAPSRGDLGIDDARLIAPGEPTRSVVAARVAALDVHRMPPLGSSVVDEAGLEAVSAWIEGLRGCP